MCFSVCREAFLRYNVVGPLSDLLDEPVDACRRNMHRALKMVAEFPAGQSGKVSYYFLYKVNILELCTVTCLGCAVESSLCIIYWYIQYICTS